MIKPTVGRVVWFWPADTTDPKFSAHPSQPCAATVAYVHSDSMVNLSVTDHNGVQHARTSVRLIQEGEPKPQFGSYCEWMPFQIGQSKREAMHPAMAASTELLS